jgi:GDP-4-dehydro-6-deoxy-D-mannose reductase
VRVLITGATGFVGKHLATYWHQTAPSVELFGTTLQATPPEAHIVYTEVELRDAKAVEALLANTRPDAIVHLAGQASIDQSFKDAWGTFENNLQPQLNLFQACLRLAIQPRILIITSAEIYGKIRPENLPLSEDTPLRPVNPYSVSKAAQDLLAQQFFFTYGLPIIRARPFNHLGPGQSENFVATSFAMQIARIEANLQEPVIRVGNLSSARDFTDVRDIVRAYALLLQHGEVGESYNIASGQNITIAHLLNTLLSLCPREIQIFTDTDRLRPIDVPVISANYDRLHQASGWRPQISLEQTLRDVLDDCRQRVQQLHRSN